MKYPITTGGKVTIYQIEAQFPDSCHERNHRVWYGRQFCPEDFGEEHSITGITSAEETRPFHVEYGACGACWQKTGVYGYLDEDIARAAYKALLKNVKRCDYVIRWRLVKRAVYVEMKTLEMSPLKETPKETADAA